MLSLSPIYEPETAPVQKEAERLTPVIDSEGHDPLALPPIQRP